MEQYIMDELYHHGIKGQKWGVRRWQNADGTFNEAGKKRYFDSNGSVGGNARRALAKVYDINERFYSKRGNKLMASMNHVAKEAQLKKAVDADRRKAEKNTPEAKAKRATQIKKAAKIGAAVVAAGLVAYGGYKLYQNNSYNKAVKNAIASEAFAERQRKGEQAMAKLYDKMVADAMSRGAVSVNINDSRINYSIKAGRK